MPDLAPAIRRRAPLTIRQQRIVYAIRLHMAEKGYPPTVREIGRAVGLQTPSAVSYQLGQLAEKGYLRRDPGPRAIALIPTTETEKP